MNNELENLLNIDSLKTVTDVAGTKHYSELNNGEEKLALVYNHHINKIKEKLLKGKDTHFAISWNNFIDLIKARGFVDGYTHNYKYKAFDGKISEEQCIIYYHPQKHLVIWATSYDNKNTVNAGTLHGRIKYNKEDYIKVKRALFQCGYEHNSENHNTQFTYDIREALFNKIRQIEEVADFMDEFEEDTFLWFLDLNEFKDDSNYKQITQEKINQCPEELRRILNR